MNIQLIQGEFSPEDTLELITQMIHIKIKYHENKISQNSNEEDVKYRESKIKRLQQELYELRNSMSEKNKNVKIDAIIKID
jgi:hypothetical protein